MFQLTNRETEWGKGEAATTPGAEHSYKLSTTQRSLQNTSGNSRYTAQKMSLKSQHLQNAGYLDIGL